MRVLHIAPGNLYGGVETLLVTLARFRDLCPSMEPEFAVCFEGRLSRELTEAGVEVHRLGAVRTRHPLSVWQARRRLADLLRQRNFDAVVCHMAWPQAVFGPVVRAAGVALVAWRHDAGDGRHWLERWARLTRPDLTICNSRFSESALESFAPGLRREVMYYPVAPAQSVFTEADRMNTRSELGAPPNSTVIIQVSRMEAWKGHQLHLRALSKLRARHDWVSWMWAARSARTKFDIWNSCVRWPWIYRSIIALSFSASATTYRVCSPRRTSFANPTLDPNHSESFSSRRFTRASQW